jgi:hypothetical protein
MYRSSDCGFGGRIRPPYGDWRMAGVLFIGIEKPHGGAVGVGGGGSVR